MTPRTCPECGASFAPRNGRQRFCCEAHKRAFHKLMAHRGQVLLPLGLAGQAGSRKGDPQSAWARGQHDALLRRWVREDRAAGRAPALVVAEKHAAKWSHVDVGTR